MHLLDLKMLHASIVDQLAWDSALRSPIKVHIWCDDKGHWSVKGSKDTPSWKQTKSTRLQKGSWQNCTQFIFSNSLSSLNEEVHTQGQGQDKASGHDDVDWVISQPLPISDPGEDRLGLDDLPDVMSHGIEAEPDTYNAGMEDQLSGELLNIGILPAKNLYKQSCKGYCEEGANAKDEFASEISELGQEWVEEEGDNEAHHGHG